MLRKSFDLSRLYGLLLIGGPLVLTFGVVDIGLRMSFGLLPEYLARNEFLKPETLDSLGGRVVAVEAEQRLTNPRPLAVLLGFSTVREAFVPSLLESAQTDVPERQWLNLGLSGASFFELAYYARPLLRSTLNPDLIVIGMHPVWMAGRVSNPDLENAGIGQVVSALRSRKLGAAKRKVKEWSWLAFNRNRINIGLRRAFSLGREHVLLGLGLGQELLYPVSLNPWVEERRYEGQGDDKLRDVQMAAWERFRWFDPKRYVDVGVQAEAALTLIRGCQSRSPRVVLVYMPEGEALRRRMPPNAEQTFEAEVLAKLETVPAILDLRDALPESDFYDHIHVNESGRLAASGQLAAKLARHTK